MNKHKSRTRLLAGSGAAACVLLASSSAYACTTYKGRMSVTVTPGEGVSTVIGSGSGSHSYCGNGRAEKVIATARPVVGVETKAIIEVAPEMCQGVSHQLVDTNYTIAFRDNAGTATAAYTGSYTSSWTQTGDRLANSCGPAQDFNSNFVPLGGNFKVERGVGSVTVPLPSTMSPSTLSLGVPTDASAICVNPVPGLGVTTSNQAPLAVRLPVQI